MKTTLVNLSTPTTALHRPSLTPELMASVGARYSRNNEGLDEILKKINWDDLDSSVDSIFRHIDFGHESISSLSPVAIFIDDISLLLAFWLWYITYTASGQESSTRYIRYSPTTLLDSDNIGIDKIDLYGSQSSGFLCYEKALGLWEERVKKYGVDVPISLKSTDEKKYNRMVRNYSFDRARYFLPLSALTNVMMIMSARSWVDVISYLLSFPAKEFVLLGERLRDELNLATPRLTQFAIAKESTRAILQAKIARLAHVEFRYDILVDSYGSYFEMFGKPEIDIDLLKFRENRYAGYEDSIRITPVKFGWKQCTMGEIRDMNRHRTGQKSISFYPNGFYSSGAEFVSGDMSCKILSYVNGSMRENFDKCCKYLKEGNIEGLYLLNLGHTFSYNHVTTLDKFLYQAELRTGEGCHYAYKKMMNDCIKLFELQLPGISKELFLNQSEYKITHI